MKRRYANSAGHGQAGSDAAAEFLSCSESEARASQDKNVVCIRGGK
jgi:hypothetical protein